ncbi:hypothetical protein [Dryocola sp. BD586]|uniref:hypothetical protein n=1 Tax=Dryocola sp. BD586 TaxID=3133271 RepID=UPI003F4F5678
MDKKIILDSGMLLLAEIKVIIKKIQLYTVVNGNSYRYEALIKLIQLYVRMFKVKHADTDTRKFYLENEHYVPK